MASTLPAPSADRRLAAVYRVRSTAGAIDGRAQAIALEQSIEAPLAVVDDARVLREVVGQVASVVPAGPDAFDVTIHLAVGDDRLRSRPASQHAVRQHVAAR